MECLKLKFQRKKQQILTHSPIKKEHVFSTQKLRNGIKITKIFGPREQISDQQKKFEIIHDLSSLTETNLEIF